MFDKLTCYIIKSGVYYIQEHKIGGFQKTKEFNGRCLFMSRDFAEKLILHLQDLNSEHFKNLIIHEHTLVKGSLNENVTNDITVSKVAVTNSPTKKGRPKKQDNIELLSERLNELEIELNYHENLDVLAATSNKEVKKVIDNINGNDIKVLFVSKGTEYIAEINFNDNDMELIIIDKETYIDDFGENGIIN